MVPFARTGAAGALGVSSSDDTSFITAAFISRILAFSAATSSSSDSESELTIMLEFRPPTTLYNVAVNLSSLRRCNFAALSVSMQFVAAVGGATAVAQEVTLSVLCWFVR